MYSQQGGSHFCGRANRGGTPHQVPVTPALVLQDPKTHLRNEGFVLVRLMASKRLAFLCGQTSTPCVRMEYPGVRPQVCNWCSPPSYHPQSPQQ